MVFEGWLQAKQPTWVPNWKATDTEPKTTDQESENADQVTKTAEPMITVWTINTIKAIMTFWIGQPHQFIYQISCKVVYRLKS